MNKKLNKILIVSLFLVGFLLIQKNVVEAETYTDEHNALLITTSVTGGTAGGGNIFFPDLPVTININVLSTLGAGYDGQNREVLFRVISPMETYDYRETIGSFGGSFAKTEYPNSPADQGNYEVIYNSYTYLGETFSDSFSVIKPAPEVAVYINDSQTDPQSINLNDPVWIYWTSKNAMEGCSCHASRGVRLGSLTAPLSQDCGNSPPDAEWYIEEPSDRYNIYGVTTDTTFTVTCSN